MRPLPVRIERQDAAGEADSVVGAAGRGVIRQRLEGADGGLAKPRALAREPVCEGRLAQDEAAQKLVLVESDGTRQGVPIADSEQGMEFRDVAAKGRAQPDLVAIGLQDR